MAHSKILNPVSPIVEPTVGPTEPAPPAKRKRRPSRRAPSPRVAQGPVRPQELGAILDEALDRMERRAAGVEKPIPLPWPRVAAALGGGLWGGTSVTVVGDTGCGKTQWALQVAAYAAGAGVPVCFVTSEPGMDQVAARLLSLKAGRRWSDLYVGNAEKEALESLRAEFADELRSLPIHLLAGNPSRPGEPTGRELASWLRGKYPEPAPGSRPLLVVQDFVEVVTGAGRDQEEYNDVMGRVAQEARLAAREHAVTMLLVSSTSREQRLSEDDTIGIHHERRRPRGLGRGNPARLLLSGKNTGDMERESDTVVVLAQEPEPGRPAVGWQRVWCAVAKNRSGSRAWCALRFNGSLFEEDETAAAGLAPPEEADTNPDD